MSFEIYIGTWTDWSRDPVLGATITLSSRDASLLLAFIAAFVTIVATRLWVIISFTAHQFLATGGKHDGLYYQRQVILRNAKSAPAAAWLFLQQAWYWRGIARSTIARTVPWAMFCVLYFIGLTLLAIFSSQISDSASEFRLVRSSRCGIQTPINRDALQDKARLDNVRASFYSKECYHNITSTLCKSLPVSNIPWTNSSVECPFGDKICLDVPAFKMETGMMDSHRDFGFNASPENRITYKRETICSPLITKPGFVEEVRDSAGTSIRYLYGATRVGTQPLGRTNYTFQYHTHGQTMDIGYSTWAYYYPSLGVWEPVDDLLVPNTDLTLIAIAPNGVKHVQPNKDPVFGASVAKEGFFLPDRYVSPIACVDKHVICNPNNDMCTPPLDIRGVIASATEARMALSNAQFVAIQRLRLVLLESSTFYHAIWTRTQGFLRAQEKVAGSTGLALPSNHWEIEMAALFDDTLANLQHRMIEYVVGPSDPANFETIKVWENIDNVKLWENVSDSDQYAGSYEDMCYNQRIRETQGTLNFSVLGLSLLIGLGSYVIIVSFILEFFMAWIQAWLGRGTGRAKRWERDGTLQQMRLLYEMQGDGVWQGTTEDFPRMVSGELFEHEVELVSPVRTV
ncbi:hypothetical protein FBEOM_496 [Fusarium beomiforme]|uniref:Uncharacterized protein n=1 Tax=Fusarium beomiforme TaxID=44412 RepID=A0A9P5AV31_9HYPO|nr:hypothetical protein FBEOM_496 [Fusarium beomiforme]